MPIDPNHLLGLKLPPLRVSVTERDAILYALGIGIGGDPLNSEQLPFVYENGLKVVPSIATVYPAMMSLSRAGNTGIDLRKLVHGSQGFRLHRPFPANADLIGQATITGLVDKGKDKGALVLLTGETRDAGTDEILATVTSTYVCRADGGFGGSGESPQPQPMPVRAADCSWELETAANLALIYRLSGDRNPLHIDPAFARRAGFDRPILHGRATFGIAAHALLKLCCDYDETRLLAMDARFTAPVYPGERLLAEIWREGSRCRFRITVPGRGVTALDNGVAELGPLLA